MISRKYSSYLNLFNLNLLFLKSIIKQILIEINLYQVNIPIPLIIQMIVMISLVMKLVILTILVIGQYGIKVLLVIHQALSFRNVFVILFIPVKRFINGMLVRINTRWSLLIMLIGILMNSKRLLQPNNNIQV